jgi:group I intron endonuclease
MRTGCIYKHTNLINGKAYIGQTIATIQRRKGGGYAAAFGNALAKYGWGNFETTILEKDIPGDLLGEREKFWISHFGTYGKDSKGYNCTTGGEGYGTTHGPLSPEHKAKLSIPVVQYDINGNFIAEYCGAKAAGDIVGVAGANITSVAAGHFHTAGGYIWVKKGDESSIESRIAVIAKLMQVKKKNSYRIAVLQYSLSGEKLNEYACINDAVRATGILKSNIILNAKGKLNCSKNYIWVYKGDEDKVPERVKANATYVVPRATRAIEQYDLQGNLIESFCSVKEASQKTGSSQTVLVDYAAGRKKHSRFIWKYKDTKRGHNV